MLDANQSGMECWKGKNIQPYTIEWLRQQRGMVDPFIQLLSKRPNSTTLTPNRDIDYVLTYGMNASAITTLSPNIPLISDLGIILDIDLGSYFSSNYSNIATPSPRILTSGNTRSTTSYIKYFSKQVENHNIIERTHQLLTKAPMDPPTFDGNDAILLNRLDSQITEIMLSAERACSCKSINRQPWSPQERQIARIYSYWRQRH